MKIISCGIVSLIMGSILPADRKDIKVVLGVIACCVIASSAFAFLQPIAELLDQVNDISKLNTQTIGILWKVVGIGLITEIASLISKDFGNGTMERMMQFVGNAAILWLTIPLFHTFLELIEDVLERM